MVTTTSFCRRLF